MSTTDAKAPQNTVASLEERLASIKAQLASIPREMEESSEMKMQQASTLRAWADAMEDYDVDGTLRQADKVSEDPEGDLSTLRNKIARQYAIANRNLKVTLPKRQKDLHVELVKTHKALGEAVMEGNGGPDIVTVSNLFRVVQMMHIKMKETQTEKVQFEKQTQDTIEKMQLEIEELKRNVRAKEMYDKGTDCWGGRNGVGINTKQAIFWYRKSAEQGNGDAQNALGKCYENGKGVKKDFKQAAFWYRKSADQGNGDAQNALGKCYENGNGVKKDFKQAEVWYRKSAEQGNALGQYNFGRSFGRSYFLGRGVDNFKQAQYWFSKSAEQNKSYDLKAFLTRDTAALVREAGGAAALLRGVGGAAAMLRAVGDTRTLVNALVREAGGAAALLRDMGGAALIQSGMLVTVDTVKYAQHLAGMKANVVVHKDGKFTATKVTRMGDTDGNHGVSLKCDGFSNALCTEGSDWRRTFSYYGRVYAWAGLSGV